MSSVEIPDIETVAAGLERQGYVTSEELATVLYLLLKLPRPLLVEGHAGVGKTEIGNALASFLGSELIRLQCYEGLDVNSAVYEWNYQKQLLSIKIQEGVQRSEREKEEHIFSKEFLLARPLLRAISAREKSPVLLIDEVDRADEEFEAFLLELLSAFQITIPELGTIRATHLPVVVLTSNRTRELSDALKRRCLYVWIDYPDLEKEMRIVRTRLPGIEEQLAGQVVAAVQRLRGMRLVRAPGVSETLDWAQALMTLHLGSLDEDSARRTLGCVLKTTEDLALVESEGLETVLK